MSGCTPQTSPYVPNTCLPEASDCLDPLRVCPAFTQCIDTHMCLARTSCTPCNPEPSDTGCHWLKAEYWTLPQSCVCVCSPVAGGFGRNSYWTPTPHCVAGSACCLAACCWLASCIAAWGRPASYIAAFRRPASRGAPSHLLAAEGWRQHIWPAVLQVEVQVIQVLQELCKV